MFILYGDDEQVARDLVVKALTAKGYKVQAIDTSRTEEMTTGLKSLVAEHGTPDILVLDGHNILLDRAGNRLYDMTPLGMTSWLRQNGLSAQCKFILYSNDDKLVEQTLSSRTLKFYGAVSKSGQNGGLMALLHIIERAAVDTSTGVEA
jgi:CheY-like chemotaxis protein